MAVQLNIEMSQQNLTSFRKIKMQTSASSLCDVPFATDNNEVNSAFQELLTLLGLEAFTSVKSINERFRSLQPISNKISFPVGTRVIDVTPDGNCLFYSLLTFILGREIEKDSKLVDIFKKHFLKLVMENKDKITSKDMPRKERGLNPTIIDFSHDATLGCCQEYHKNPTGYHTNSFCNVRNSRLGDIPVYDIESWCEVMSWNNSWGGSEVLTILAGLTGITFFSYHMPRLENLAEYMSFKSKTKYGFKKLVQGANVVLLHVNENHYQVLIPEMDVVDEQTSRQTVRSGVTTDLVSLVVSRKPKSQKQDKMKKKAELKNKNNVEKEKNKKDMQEFETERQKMSKLVKEKIKSTAAGSFHTERLSPIVTAEPIVSHRAGETHSRQHHDILSGQRGVTQSKQSETPSSEHSEINEAEPAGASDNMNKTPISGGQDYIGSGDHSDNSKKDKVDKSQRRSGVKDLHGSGDNSDYSKKEKVDQNKRKAGDDEDNS